MWRAIPRTPSSLQAFVLVFAAVAAPDPTHADHAASAGVYVRNDTDHTVVVSPRLHLRSMLLEETHLDLSYTVDVWTSASVDIVASASQAVTEQRDELNVGLDHAMGDVTLAAGYRYSVEPDYVSHGGSASISGDLANKAATLAWSLAGSSDQVGRAGDPRFSEAVDTLVTGVSFTQVIDPDTLAQALYELSLVRGYQASAYRFVALGFDGLCYGQASFCRPEQNPRERMRHALALRLRRALGKHWSVGGGYRAYLDDWGIVSHTIKADLALAPDPRSTLALTYRFYLQGAADHYKPLYLENDRNARYFTRDKELSPLSSHRVALELDRVWELADGAAGLVTGLELAPSFYRYDDFLALDRVTAIEVTAVIGMELP
jgi:hypothetical protein